MLPFQLSGEPKWSETDRFDITAIDASGEQITADSMKPLLQGLLADRFHLRAHWETQERPVYVLVVDNGGPKFQPHVDAAEQRRNTSRVAGKATIR